MTPTPGPEPTPEPTPERTTVGDGHGSHPDGGSVPVIAITDLEFRHPDGTQALAGVDLVVQPGERIAILGPNGAGKTTLALHLNGLLAVQSGSVRIGGLEVGDHLAEVRRRVGLVFQDADDQLFLGTVRDDVAFGPANLGLRGDALDQRVHAALQAVGMEAAADKPPHHLSGGERRRVAIATVLAMEPDVLVLDEPSAGMDPVGVHTLAAVLAELDVTLVVITHDLPFALQTCVRSVVMDHGRIVADRRTNGLLTDNRLMMAHRLALPFGWGRTRRSTDR